MLEHLSVFMFIKNFANMTTIFSYRLSSVFYSVMLPTCLLPCNSAYMFFTYTVMQPTFLLHCNAAHVSFTL